MKLSTELSSDQGFRSRMTRLALVAASVCSVTLASVALAGTTETVNFLAAADASLFEPESGSPANADGLGPSLFIGRTGANAGFTLRRALLRFDIDGMIPAGAAIDAVELTVTVSGVPPVVESLTSRLHRVTTPWSEGPSVGTANGGLGQPAETGDATWFHTSFDTDLWTSPGGDFAVDESASVSMAGFGDYVFSTGGGGAENMVADVQGWLDDPMSNYGWIIRGDEGFDGPNARRLSSREATSSEPVLTVTYTFEAPPPGGDPTDIPVSSTAGLWIFFAVLAAGGWWTLKRQ